MKLLAIETSTEHATVAITTSDGIYQVENNTIRQHAKQLLPMTETVLSQAGLNISQLDGIVFGRGPGSFTGLRIACSVAKALAYAHDLPVYPVSTLETIATLARKHFSKTYPSAPILAVIDARMNQLYWACFDMDGSEAIEQVSDAGDIDYKKKGPILLAGFGFESYLHQFKASLQNNITEHFAAHPTAEMMINLVQSGQVPSTNAEQAMPVYIRNKVTHGGPGG